jgi:CRP-like cAMP-binding protein
MGVFAWNMGWEDWAGNFCYLILAVSYLVTNLYWLRMLAILALGLEGIYFYFASTPPLWVGIAWAVVFVSINVIQIMLMTRERLRVRMSEQETLMHHGLFRELTSVEFHRLLKIGAWREIAKGASLTIEGEPVPELFFIAKGSARVMFGDKLIAMLHPGAVVGEMSFISGGNASATVVAEAPLTTFVIGKPALSALLKHDHCVETAIFKMIGRDLTTKLRAVHERRERAGEATPWAHTLQEPTTTNKPNELCRSLRRPDVRADTDWMSNDAI